MGSLFGGLLAEGGADVTLVDIWREHVDAINGNGLRIVGYGGERAVRVAATLDPQAMDAADVVLFQCKAYANEAAAKSVRHLFERRRPSPSRSRTDSATRKPSAACSASGHVLGGLTAQGAVMVVEPGVVRNFGDLPTYIGELEAGSSERALAIADAFTRHHLPTHGQRRHQDATSGRSSSATSRSARSRRRPT